MRIKNRVSKTHTTYMFCKGHGFNVLSSLLPQYVLLFTETSHHLLPTEAGEQINLKDYSVYNALQLKIMLIIK